MGLLSIAIVMVMLGAMLVRMISRRGVKSREDGEDSKNQKKENEEKEEHRRRKSAEKKRRQE